jgi:hypothetical protein
MMVKNNHFFLFVGVLFQGPVKNENSRISEPQRQFFSIFFYDNVFPYLCAKILFSDVKNKEMRSENNLNLLFTHFNVILRLVLTSVGRRAKTRGWHVTQIFLNRLVWENGYTDPRGCFA